MRKYIFRKLLNISVDVTARERKKDNDILI